MEYFFLRTLQLLMAIKKDEIAPGNITRNPEEWMSLYSFPQTWGSTALGFKGMGGASITKAQTTVVRTHRYSIVFFGRRTAYMCSSTCANFFNDLKNQNIASIHEAEKQYEKFKELTHGF